MRPNSTLAKLPRLARKIRRRSTSLRDQGDRANAPYSPVLSLALLLILGLAATIGA